MQGFFFSPAFRVKVLENIFAVIDPSYGRSICVTPEKINFNAVISRKARLDKFSVQIRLKLERARPEFSTFSFGVIAGGKKGQD